MFGKFVQREWWYRGLLCAWLVLCGVPGLADDPAMGKDLEYTDWQGEFSRRVQECGKILDQAYPPIQIPVSAVNLETLSVSKSKNFVVEMNLNEPQEGVTTLYWPATSLEQENTFLEDVRTGRYQSFFITRSQRKASVALQHHSTMLLMGLSFGKRNSKYDETIKKLNQFLQDLNHCPTPNLIKVYHPCTRCLIEQMINSSSKTPAP